MTLSASAFSAPIVPSSYGLAELLPSSPELLWFVSPIASFSPSEGVSSDISSEDESSDSEVSSSSFPGACESASVLWATEGWLPGCSFAPSAFKTSNRFLDLIAPLSRIADLFWACLPRFLRLTTLVNPSVLFFDGADTLQLVPAEGTYRRTAEGTYRTAKSFRVSTSAINVV
ncbi:hypothetical protein R1flu_015367 [Riccia fluitans]|uniref:Secreted protein n=1 Tax=Riccia fluitans TaxID=41844 RepID=A0ABD1YJ81_9MARC